MRDVTNGYGGITVEQVDEGDTVATKPLKPSYAFLRAGVLKIESISADGSVLVTGFLFAGEPVPASHVEAPVTITALTPAAVCRLSASSVLAREDGAGQILDTFSAVALSQAVEDQRRLARSREGTAAERLHWFLTDMSQRTFSSDIELCMSRAEIGAYLGLRSESVSRAFRALERRGAIERKSVRELTVN